MDSDQDARNGSSHPGATPYAPPSETRIPLPEAGSDLPASGMSCVKALMWLIIAVSLTAWVYTAYSDDVSKWFGADDQSEHVDAPSIASDSQALHEFAVDEDGVQRRALEAELIQLNDTTLVRLPELEGDVLLSLPNARSADFDRETTAEERSAVKALSEELKARIAAQENPAFDWNEFFRTIMSIIIAIVGACAAILFVSVFTGISDLRRDRRKLKRTDSLLPESCTKAFAKFVVGQHLSWANERAKSALMEYIDSIDRDELTYDDCRSVELALYTLVEGYRFKVLPTLSALVIAAACAYWLFF